jgi:hypothetical protein
VPLHVSKIFANWTKSNLEPSSIETRSILASSTLNNYEKKKGHDFLGIIKVYLTSKIYILNKFLNGYVKILRKNTLNIFSIEVLNLLGYFKSGELSFPS